MIEFIEEKGLIFAPYDKAQKLHQKNFGTKEGNKLHLSLYETLYLLENEKITLTQKGKELTRTAILKKKECKREEYLVYKDLKTKGYVPKTALKYGFTFRVYDKGKANEHAPWLLQVITEKTTLKTQELSAMNRLAHSTHKKVLLAILDSEDSILYIEQSWKKI